MHPSVSKKRAAWFRKTQDAKVIQTRAQLASDIAYQEQRRKEILCCGVSNIMEIHRDEMKNDPECLTDEFIKRILGTRRARKRVAHPTKVFPI
jgi:hypothetical protein